MEYTFIKDNTLLIVPNNIKDNILKYINSKNKLIDVKFMSLTELKKKYLFDYDEQTIYYLVNKYNIKPSIAKIYLENMYYINDKNYSSKKLNDLKELKKELIENKLLIVDKFFKHYLKQKNIIVYGYDYIDKFTTNILEEIKNITDLEIIEKEKSSDKNLSVYEFNDIDDEIDFVAIKIIELINSGIDINNIKLANVSSEYNNSIEKIFGFYNIPIELNNGISIYETIIGNKFLELCNNYKNLESVVETLKEEINLNNEDNLNLFNKIINICNNYSTNNINNGLIECLITDLKNTKYKNKVLNNCIQIINLKDNIIDDDIYVFVIGFNQGNIPVIHKDEEYISDIYKNEINIETTVEKNVIEKNIIKNILNGIRNLTLSYKLKSPFDTYYPSGLVNVMDMEVVKYSVDYDETYSKVYNKIKLSKMLDNLVKYNEIDNNLGVLYNNYKDIEYLTFDNKFDGINPTDLYEFLNNKLLLSYSSIDNFYRCKFRYYINNILKLSKYEETFPMFIGSMFHYILSICFNNNFDFENEWNEYLKNRELTNKEKFFLRKLKNELLFIIDTIKYQNKLSEFDKSMYEKKIYINKDKNIKITFMGIVDKIMYKEEDNKTLVAIIDYKTGHPETSLNNTIYGIGMQLPVYIYLTKNSNLFSKVEFAGIYLQKILNNEVMVNPGDDVEKLKRDNLKLIGYSTSNEETLGQFDFSYKDSEVIKSMKMSSKGFYSYAKVIDDDKFDKLSNIVDQKIDESINDILKGKFDINPKRIGTSNLGCEFCTFRDVCYMSEKDIVNLKEHKDLDFLENNN